MKRLAGRPPCAGTATSITLHSGMERPREYSQQAPGCIKEQDHGETAQSPSKQEAGTKPS